MRIDVDKILGKKEKRKPEILFFYLLGLFIEEIGLWSRDGLVSLANNLFGLVTESFDSYTKRYSDMRAYFTIKVSMRDRDEILSWFFNTYLSAEKLPLLPGFGFTNRFGDKIKGNPEYHSIYTGYTGYKGQ